MTISNMLSASRLAMVPVLLVLAWQGLQWAFVMVLVLSFVSDLLDGMIARRLGQASMLGAKLDSWGDFAVYMSLPLCAWWLVPDAFLRNRLYFAAAALSVVLPPLLAWVKFRGPSSYHTWMVKLAVLVLGCSVTVFFAGGPDWPFRLAVPLGVLAGLEEIAITLVLREPRSNVHTVFHAMRRP